MDASIGLLAPSNRTATNDLLLCLGYSVFKLWQTGSLISTFNPFYFDVSRCASISICFFWWVQLGFRVFLVGRGKMEKFHAAFLKVDQTALTTSCCYNSGSVGATFLKTCTDHEGKTQEVQPIIWPGQKTNCSREEEQTKVSAPSFWYWPDAIPTLVLIILLLIDINPNWLILIFQSAHYSSLLFMRQMQQYQRKGGGAHWIVRLRSVSRESSSTFSTGPEHQVDWVKVLHLNTSCSLSWCRMEGGAWSGHTSWPTRPNRPF